MNSGLFDLERLFFVILTTNLLEFHCKYSWANRIFYYHPFSGRLNNSNKSSNILGIIPFSFSCSLPHKVCVFLPFEEKFHQISLKNEQWLSLFIPVWPYAMIAALSHETNCTLAPLLSLRRWTFGNHLRWKQN